MVKGVVYVVYGESGRIEPSSAFDYHQNMKFLIASDIHGSRPATEKIKEIFTEGSFDMLLLLGDLLYHGPRNDLPEGYAPKEVIRLLSSLQGKIITVRGNCEAEVDQMVLPFPVLSEMAMVFADGRKIFMTHGHSITPSDPPEGIDCFFSGHTHIPVLERKDGILFLNPGSVSIPKGGYEPSYAVWDGGTIMIKELWTGKVILEMGTSA